MSTETSTKSTEMTTKKNGKWLWSWPIRFVGSMPFAVGLLLVLAVVMGWATVLDSRYGADASAFGIYHSWWFVTLCGLLGLSVLVSTLLRFPWKKHQLGFVVTHLGILVLLAGCGISLFWGTEGTLGVYEGTQNHVATQKAMQFVLKLQQKGEDASAKGSTAEGTTADGTATLKIPFTPGPFSWAHYAKLPAFPWKSIRSSRTTPVLYDRDGIKLEVLDYRTCVAMVPVKQGEVEDIPGGRIEAAPLEALKDAEKNRKYFDLSFAKVRLTLDGKAQEGWVRLFTPDPLDLETDGAANVQAPSALDGDCLILEGEKRAAQLTLQPEEIQLDTAFYLERFNRRLDPGTSMAAHYSSDVQLRDRSQNTQPSTKSSTPATLRVNLNQPLDFYDAGTRKTWRMYQSSFRGPIAPEDPVFAKVAAPDDSRDELYMSWFTISCNPGRGWMYLGCLLVVLGIATMFSMKAYFFGKGHSAQILLAAVLSSTMASLNGTTVYAEEPASKPASSPISAETASVPASNPAPAAPVSTSNQPAASASSQAAPVTSLLYSKVPVDLSAWETLPVFHQGRIMPLDAYARLVVLQICGRENPRIQVSASVKRKFSSSELYFAWLAEPEKWEQVAFMPLENEELRKMAGLPILDDAGQRLAKISPEQALRFYNSDAYQKFVTEMDQAREKSPEKAYPPEKKPLLDALGQLQAAYVAFRSLTFNPMGTTDIREDFLRSMMAGLQIWRMQGLEQTALRVPMGDGQVNRAREISASLLTLSRLFADNEQKKIPVTFERLAVPTAQLATQSELLYQEMAQYVGKLLKTPKPDGIQDEEWQYVRTTSRTRLSQMKRFSETTNQMLAQLYDDGEAPGFLPAMNANALDARRGEAVQTSPWLTLNALLYGTEEGILRAFPAKVQPLLMQCRMAFADMLIAWRAGKTADLATASHKLAESLQKAAMDSEKARVNLLPENRRDADILAATAYPKDTEKLRGEVFYYHARLFVWAWVFPFVSAFLLMFAAILGWEIKRKAKLQSTESPWLRFFRTWLWRLGVVLMAAAVLAMTVGLGMRSWIMERAPVTNMFETIIFVAWTVGVMGLWTMLRHVISAPLKYGWQATSPCASRKNAHENATNNPVANANTELVESASTTAEPASTASASNTGAVSASTTTESASTTVESSRTATISTSTIAWCLLPLRLILTFGVLWVLALSQFGLGEGYNAISLTPRLAIGASFPTLSDWVVWFSGIVMLGVLMVWVPRLVLTPLAALVVLPKLPKVAFQQNAGAPKATTTDVTTADVKTTNAITNASTDATASASTNAFTDATANAATNASTNAAANVSTDATANASTDATADAALQQRIYFGIAAAVGVFVIAYVAYFCTSLFNANLRNLMPILRDNYWLSVHVITIVASYGAGMLAWLLGIFALLLYTFGKYTPAEKSATSSEHRQANPPAICATLSELIYRCMQVAVLLLVVGTILGGLWADVSWGRFWSWDRKEVWALISLFVYLLILHARHVRLLGEFTLAVGAVFGALTILMAWYGVNYILGSTLHGYGAGVGGLGFFGIVAVVNLVLVAAATLRKIWS